MTTCPFCQQPASKRDGRDAAGRQRYACRPCGRDFTAHSASAFAGYRWPAEVILLAVRWSLSHPLSATSVMELLAERGIDISKRTVLRWVQAFGPRTRCRSRGSGRPTVARSQTPWATIAPINVANSTLWQPERKTGRRCRRTKRRSPPSPPAPPPPGSAHEAGRDKPVATSASWRWPYWSRPSCRRCYRLVPGSSRSCSSGGPCPGRG